MTRSLARHAKGRRLAAVLLVLAGCGGTPAPVGEPRGPAEPGPEAAPVDATISIGPDGVSPAQLVVRPGARVRFVNLDDVAHRPVSDPDPIHDLCPELNAPTLAPGAGFAFVAPASPKQCPFHDFLRPSAQALQGLLVVE